MKDNLLRDVKFVKLATVHELAEAEAIQKALRNAGVGSVIINDEKYQARPEPERGRAVTPEDGFRIEVPEVLVEKARQALGAFRKGRE